MNAAGVLATACMAVAAASVAALVVRRWRSTEGLGQPERSPLPILLRVVRPLAALLEPLAACTLSQARAQRIGADLEALGLWPVITPSRWEAARMALAALLGAVAALVPGGGYWPALLLSAAGYLSANAWLARQRRAQQRSIVRELPAWLDLMTVCVEAGATLTSGLRLIVSQAPPSPLRDYFERVLREVRGGRARSQAFAVVAGSYQVESLNALASALSHAEAAGVSLGQLLRSQAEQRVAERFAFAEKLAMQAPVKMLGPLIFCIFPCTFIVIGVPIAVRLREALGA